MQINSDNPFTRLDRLPERNLIRSSAANAPKQGAPSPEAPEPEDNIDLSFDPAQVDKLKQAAKELPDVRADKVAEIKAKIQSGNYHVSAEDIADKMINRGSGEDLF